MHYVEKDTRPMFSFLDSPAADPDRQAPWRDVPLQQGALPPFDPKPTTTVPPKNANDSDAAAGQDAQPLSFADLGLSELTCRTLAEIGYESPSAIQSAVIPVLLEGRDLIGQAQTGTGKTAAFALPVLERLAERSRGVACLVLTPTRELAIQVAEAFSRYGNRRKGFKVLALYGGQEYSKQIRRLDEGVQVVVGTPGRVMDHMRRATLDLQSLQTLVLDEADEMLRMGFQEDVEWILSQTPPSRQVALFSATMPPAIRRIARKHLSEAEEVTIAQRTRTASSIRQRWLPVSNHLKLDALTRLLQAERFDAALLFVRTRQDTAELAERLGARGYATAALSGDMAQRQRERTVQQVRDGKIDVVVATDVAARGLDLDRISHVINVDLPYDVEAYVHRIGRTGRAGRSGEAVLFVQPREERMLRALEQATGQRMERYILPTPEMLREQRAKELLEAVSDALASPGIHAAQRLVGEWIAGSGLDAADIAAGLVLRALGDMAEPEAVHQPAEPAGKPASRPAEAPPAAKTPRAPRPAEAQPEMPKTRREPSSGLIPYRVDVGAEHGVQPGQLVGALVNEGGLSPGQIGRIAIYPEYSTVELPLDIPQKQLRVLKRIWVCERPLRVSLPEDAATERPSTPPVATSRKRSPEGATPPRTRKAAGAPAPAGRPGPGRRPAGPGAGSSGPFRKKNFPK